MDSERINGPDGPHGFVVRGLLEDIARQIEDLGTGVESLQDLAGELGADPGSGLRRNMLLRLQLIDSLSQRLAVLPAVVRSLKSSIPEDLAIEDADSRRVFSAAVCAYLGATATNPAETVGDVGDCELWNG